MKTTKFKPSEVGPIPEEWEVKALGEIGEFKNGISKGADSFGHGVPFVNLLDVFGKSSLETTNGLGLVEATHSEIADCGLKQGDTLFVRSSVKPEGVGLATVIEGVMPNTVFSGFLLRYRTTELVTGYMRYAFAESQFRQRVIASSTVSANTNVNQTALKRLFVAVPPRPEQEKIAEALSDVDALLAAMTTLIEKKRAIKQGAMQQLLGMRNDELGMRNEPIRRLAGFSGAWVEKRFDECFELFTNNTYSREFMCSDTTGIANIHYGDILIKYGSVLDFQKERVDSLTSSLLIKCEILKDGDLIIADTAEDETVGKAIEVQHLGSRQAVAGLHTIACRPTVEFAPGWLGYYINSSTFHNQLLPLITGTKVSSISKSGLRTTVLAIPPTLAEQKAIAAVLSDMDAEIVALEAKRAKYECVKQGMMQELLTGKTRIKGE